MEWISNNPQAVSGSFELAMVYSEAYPGHILGPKPALKQKLSDSTLD